MKRPYKYCINNFIAFVFETIHSTKSGKYLILGILSPLKLHVKDFIISGRLIQFDKWLLNHLFITMVSKKHWSRILHYPLTLKKKFHFNGFYFYTVLLELFEDMKMPSNCFRELNIQDYQSTFNTTPCVVQ